MKQTARRERNTADYGYPSPDMAALSAKALEVTRRLTEFYGEVPFSSNDPMSQLVDIILSHRTRDEQTAAAWNNLLKRFGSWEAVRDAPTGEVQETRLLRRRAITASRACARVSAYITSREAASVFASLPRPREVAHFPEA